MTDKAPPLFVVTGGPGAGKTTLIDALARAGFVVAPEAGRRIIRERQASGGRALPWIDPLLFAEAMLDLDAAAYRSHTAVRAPVFFDRGIPDIVGYLRLEGLPVPPHVVRAAQTLRYQRRAFICPPWPQIYGTDSERRQTPEIAEKTYRMMVATYGDYGYELVEVPRVSTNERVRFLLEAIEA